MNDVSDWHFKDEITEPHDGFKKWMKENLERIGEARQRGTLPYWIKDNPKYFGRADARHAARTADEIRRIQDLADLHTYGQGYVDNVHEIEKALNMKRGKRMNHEDANTGNVNPNFGKTGYGNNCSTCSVVYILRRMGFNVEALPNTSKNPLVVALSKGSTTWEKWNNGLTAYNSTLDWMNAKGYNLMNKKQYMKFIDEKTKEPGIYEFNVGYKKGGGHSTLLRRNSDGTIERIEQQVIGSWTTLDNLLNNLSGRPHKIRGIMRVDNALFNTAYSAIVKVK